MEAVNWWRKAAEQNHGDAQLALGICHFSGQGVAKDEVEAVKWWRKAADRGLVGSGAGRDQRGDGRALLRLGNARVEALEVVAQNADQQILA